MARATLNEMLDQLKALEANELRELAEAVQRQIPPQEETMRREAFHRALLASGLVRQIKPPRLKETTGRRLIEAQGKPVSETIIEERR